MHLALAPGPGKLNLCLQNQSMDFENSVDGQASILANKELPGTAIRQVFIQAIPV